MTYLEAKMILDPATSRDYIRDNKLEVEDVEEACRVACKALDKVIHLEEDLRSIMINKYMEDDLK